MICDMRRFVLAPSRGKTGTGQIGLQSNNESALSDEKTHSAGKETLMKRKPQEASLADDLLDGVAQISAFTGWAPEVIYRHSARLPLFKFHGRWHARKSRLLRHLEEMEDKNTIMAGAE
jgi:hypothetical protein